MEDSLLVLQMREKTALGSGSKHYHLTGDPTRVGASCTGIIQPFTRSWAEALHSSSEFLAFVVFPPSLISHDLMCS